MALEIANGPNYSNRTVSGKDPGSRFIPEIWSSKLLVKFYEATILAAISNTDYEGEITSYGDKVYIRTTPDIQIYDYQKGKDLDYDEPESESVELLIDQGKHFNFTCDDVDAFQADINKMDDWSNDASEQMKISIDRDVLSSIYADAAPENQGPTAGKISESYDMGEAGAPVQVTRDNVIDHIVNMGTVLDEQDIPEEGRWLALPSWMVGMIKQSDLKDASLAGDGTSILRNGRVGMIDRFTLYRSNLLDYSDESGTRAFHMMAGHTSALTFASQMTKMETLRNPNRFGDLMRGLNVYGYEVLKPESLVHFYGVRG